MKIKQWANTLINLILLNLLDSLLFYDLFHILISVLLHLKGVMHFLNKVLHMKLPILVGGKCLWKLHARHNIGRHHHSLTLWHLLVSISVIGVRLEWRHQRSFKVKLLSRRLLSLCWCWSRGLRIGLLSDEGRLRLLICIEIEEIEIIYCIVLILGSGMFFQEIEFIPEFMEYICRAMFCARIGAYYSWLMTRSARENTLFSCLGWHFWLNSRNTGSSHDLDETLSVLGTRSLSYICIRSLSGCSLKSWKLKS